jgi:hypothetical protein
VDATVGQAVAAYDATVGQVRRWRGLLAPRWEPGARCWRAAARWPLAGAWLPGPGGRERCRRLSARRLSALPRNSAPPRCPPAQVAAAVDTATQQALAALPEPAREVVVAAAGAAKAAAEQAAAHPLPAAGVTAAVVVPLYLRSYLDK